jgi:hypothetical protein
MRRYRLIRSGGGLRLAAFCAAAVLAGTVPLRAQSDGTSPDFLARASSENIRCTFDNAKLDEALRSFAMMDSTYLAPLGPLVGEAGQAEIVAEARHLARLLESPAVAGCGYGHEGLREVVRGARRMGTLLGQVLGAARGGGEPSAERRMAYERAAAVARALDSVNQLARCGPVVRAAGKGRPMAGARP